MNTVGSQFPANLFLPQNISTLRVQAAELQSFRTQEQVLATIIEVNQEQGEAVLEIGGKSYRAPLNETMQPGQLLQLQVIKGEPAPEFKVLGISKQDQLSQLFALLAQPYDWSKLADQVQFLAKDNPQLSALANLFRQFRQVISPGEKVPDEIAQAIKVLTSQLQSLNSQAERQEASPLLPGYELVFKRSPGDSPAAVHNWTRLLTQLKEHIDNGQQLPDLKARGQWYGQTRELLGQLQSMVKGEGLSAPLMRNLGPLLNQLQQATPVTPQLVRDIQQLHSLVQKQTVTGMLSQDFISGDRLPVAKAEGGGAPLPRQSPGPGAASAPVSGSGSAPQGKTPESVMAGNEPQVRPGVSGSQAVQPAGLDKVVRQLVTLLQDADETVPLPAKVVGQLEGALVRSVETGQVAIEHLPYINNLLQQLNSSPDAVTLESFRAKLGVLSLLLGFSLEKSGRDKAADVKASLLQQSLLALKDQLAGKGDEPLQRLELLQLCRDKLADQQVQFIPLPFADLEEGYLLIRQHSYTDKEAEKETSYEELQLSMALRLSAIGSVRVDMLYSSSGLRLQIAGENRQKMHYLETFSDDLKGR